MGSNAPAIRFAGFEGPWERKRLGEVSAFLGNNTLSRANLADADGSALDIHYGDVLIKYGSVLHASTAGLPEIGTRDSEKLPIKDRLADGDMVFADTAEDTTAGKCCEIRGCGDKPVYAGLHTIPVRPSETFAKGYLGHYLNSSAYHDQLISLMQGTKVISVSRRNLSDSLLAFPSFSEQEAIGSLLSALDSLIEAEGDRLAALRAARESMLARMFPRESENVPEIRFAGFDGVWERKRLGELYLYAGSGGTPNASNSDYYDGEIPFLGISDIQSRYIGSTEKHLTQKGLDNSSAWIVPIGAICLAMYASVGRVGISSVELSTSQAFFNMVFDDTNLRDFVYSRLVKAESENEWDRLVSTGTQSNLNAEKIKNWSLLMPTAQEEQRAIGSFFSGLDALIEARAMRVETLRRVRGALLARMFC